MAAKEDAGVRVENPMPRDGDIPVQFHVFTFGDGILKPLSRDTSLAMHLGTYVG